MPIFKIKNIYIKLVENTKRIDVLNKKTGVITTFIKYQDETTYRNILKKNWEFYTLQLIK